MSNDEFAAECLKHHNTFRKMHNAPDLVLDVKLNDFAQEWAISLAAKDTLEHREENDYGENLYVGEIDLANWTAGAKDAVQSWYEEIEHFNFDEGIPTNHDQIFHFGQVVWKTTERLGVGVATSESGRLFVVCFYDPPGVKPLEAFYDNVDTPPGMPPRKKKVPPQKPKPPTTQEASAQAVVESLKSVSALQKTASEAMSSMKSGKSSFKTDRDSVSGGGSSVWITPSFEARLRAIPPEELRVWSGWLINVAEQASREWHEWILNHIDLTLRLNEYLVKARKDIERKEQGVKFSKIILAKSMSVIGSELSVDPPLPSGKSADSLGIGFMRYNGYPNYYEEEEAPSYEGEEYEGEQSDEGDFPMTASELEALRRKICEKIPLPSNECEMWQLIEDIRHQARRYQLLYDHWINICNKVAMTILGTPMDGTKDEQEAAMQSVFGFLQDEMNFEVPYESEFEGYLDKDGRERIVCRHLQLFFKIKDEDDCVECPP